MENWKKNVEKLNSFIIEGNMGTSVGPYGVLPYYDSINVPDAAGSIERNEFTWLPILHGKTAKPQRIVFEGNSGRIDKGARSGAAQRGCSEEGRGGGGILAEVDEPKLETGFGPSCAQIQSPVVIQKSRSSS